MRLKGILRGCGLGVRQPLAEHDRLSLLLGRSAASKQGTRARAV